MNITETYQRYINYQTQSDNSTSKVQSNEEFLSALQNFKSYKTEDTTKIELKEEEYDEKYQTGLHRYNGLSNGDKKWLENSFLEKDQNGKNDFINYLSELSDLEYVFLNLTFLKSFGNLELVPDGKGNAKQKEGSAEKNPTKEFRTIGNTINYFNSEINNLIEGARKFGGDPSFAIESLTDVLNFFKDYQSKEQENQYQALGNQN